MEHQATGSKKITRFRPRAGLPGKVRHVPRSLLRAMAPVHRRPRAALAMDTIDMAFDAHAARDAFADLPMSDIRLALEKTREQQRSR